ncbi:MAG: preprotein translocase subunit SecG [Gemmatimonadetes bacterium]|nr:MAG: preprotein translocase subunit SecG [Gemmatimonadota bacterium]
MVYSSAARRSIRTAGPSLCAPAQPRYLAPRMYTVLVAILILDSLILTAAVLLQAGQGGGLASMGGGAGTETIMGGRQATTLLTKVTWWTAGIFLFLALVLTFMSQSATQVRSVLEGQAQQQAPTPVQQTPLPIETQPTAPPATPPQPPPPSNRRP